MHRQLSLARANPFIGKLSARWVVSIFLLATSKGLPVDHQRLPRREAWSWVHRRFGDVMRPSVGQSGSA
eukprot:943041-Pyramimonas_sp.AAC.1